MQPMMPQKMARSQSTTDRLESSEDGLMLADSPAVSRVADVDRGDRRRLECLPPRRLVKQIPTSAYFFLSRPNPAPLRPAGMARLPLCREIPRPRLRCNNRQCDSSVEWL